jgi:hypothetical protein
MSEEGLLEVTEGRGIGSKTVMQSRIITNGVRNALSATAATRTEPVNVHRQP